MPSAAPTLAQLAERINRHLTRIEADPTLNPVSERGVRIARFSGATAYANGPRIRIVYKSWQSGSHMTKTEAARYLAALDAGYTGTHHSHALSAWDAEQ